MLGQKMLMAASEGYKVDAVVFDGTNDYLAHSTDFTGNADSKVGIFSMWVKPNTFDTEQRLYIDGNSRIQFNFRGSNKFRILGRNSIDGNILNIESSTAYAISIWHHILISWDLANTTGKMYVDGVDDTNATTLTNDTLDYTASQHRIGANNSAGEKFGGDIAELYFNFAEYLDLSVQANRKKFRTASGVPVNLGTDGSAPTGTAPIVYLHLDVDEAANNFAANAGGGGGLAVTGALTTAATSPSD